jgi:hypothetical protein
MRDSATNVDDNRTRSVLSIGAVSRTYSTLASTSHRFSQAGTSPSSRKHKHRDPLTKREAQISRFLVEAVSKHDLALWLLQQSNGAWQMYSDHLAMYRNELEGRCLGRSVSLTSSKNPLDCFDGQSLDLRTLVCDVNKLIYIHADHVMRGLKKLLEIRHQNITVSEAFYRVVARRPIPKTKRLGEKECLFLSLRGLYPPNSFKGEAASALR